MRKQALAAQGDDLAVGEIDTVGKSAHDEVVEGVRKIGALATHALEVGTCQRKERDWSVRGYGCGARSAPEEAHFAQYGMGRNATHAQAFPVVHCNIDGKRARGEEIDVVGGLALTIEDLRAGDISAGEIRDEVGGGDGRAELMLKPSFEAREVSVGIELRLGEQLIFAPSQREVEIGKELMPTPSAEERAELQRPTIGRRQRAIDERCAALFTKIAQFGEADGSGGVGA